MSTESQSMGLGADDKFIEEKEFFRKKDEIIQAIQVENTAQVTVSQVATLNEVDSLAAVANTVQPNIIIGTAKADKLEGTAANDHILGLEGNDTLYGYNGNDILEGGIGADSMLGGNGDDIYYMVDSSDIIVEAADAGVDSVVSEFDCTLGANLENLYLVSSADLRGVGNGLDNRIEGTSGNNVLLGNGGNDILFGREGNDSLNGGVGYDTLDGGAGDDTLDGGAGPDLMAGGLGNDVYYVGNSGDIVAESAAEGDDTVISTISYLLGGSVENLHLVGTGHTQGAGNALANTIIGNEGNNTISGDRGDDTLIGNGGNDVLHGDEGNDVLDGGLGTDTLDGGEGADIMRGGEGDDYYVVDNVDDKIEEEVDMGADSVYSSVDYSLGANLEALFLTGTENLKGVGNNQANVLIGNDGDNVLLGERGNDELNGGAGNDLLNGGVGYDTLYGGLGNDTLDGGPGPDQMYGGEGDDLYYVGNADDVATELANEGKDTVISAVSYILGNHLEDLVLTGTANLSATGNSLSNVITGNSGNNLITAGVGHDTLYGGDGNDTLDGGPGGDLMEGGAGDDLYYVGNTVDSVVELADAGIDTVISGISYTLGANVENLTLSGTGNFYGTGNSLSNVMIGNSGNNRLIAGVGHDTLEGGAGNDTLDGGAGADSMMGGVGNDVYYVSNSGDAVIELNDEGIDTVLSGISYTLGDHVENLSLTGKNNLTGTGNGLNNLIIGNTGNNVLYADAGDDILDGGAGRDTLNGGLGNDTFVFRLTLDSLFDSPDRILDFGSGDVLDFSKFDANPDTAAFDAFTFIGGAQFDDNTVGQLRFEYNAETELGVLYANTSLGSAAEFALELANVSFLSQSNIIL